MKSLDATDRLTQDGNGNTRLKPIIPLYCHCDYLRIRCEQITVSKFTQLLDFLGQKISCEMDRSWSPGGNALYYENRIEGIEGIRGGFTVDEDGCVSTMIDLSGTYFKQLNPVDQIRLFSGLYYAYQVKCSRIDLAIDDYSFSVIPAEEMWEAAQAEKGYRFRRIRGIESGTAGRDLVKTREYGSRESGDMVRVYNHKSECMRYETEYKRKFAQPVFERLATLERPSLFDSGDVERPAYKMFHASDNHWSNVIQKDIASLALGAIDFIDRKARTDKKRGGIRDSERCGFYQAFIDQVDASPFRVRFCEPPRTIRKSLEWVKRQVAPTLAMLAGGLGRHRFNLLMQQIVGEGELRMDKLKQLWELEIKEHPKIIPI